MKKAIVFLLASVLAANSMADMPPKPERCPDAALVKQIGISSASGDSTMTIATNRDNYGTQESWLLMVITGPQNFGLSMIDNLSQLLSAVSGSPAPIDLGQGEWGCPYPIRSPSQGIVWAMEPIPTGANATMAASLLIQIKKQDPKNIYGHY